MNGQTTPKPRKRRIVLWTFLAILILGMVWTFGSQNPFAQGIRETIGSKPDQLVLNKSFSLPPRGFRYYTFTLPKDSKSVSVVGSFNTSVAQAGAATPTDGTQPQMPTAGAGIEVYLLGEADLARWQSGSPTNSNDQIGVGAKGSLRHDLPDGPGLFYLVFSNRHDPSSSKTVNAVARLRSKSWLPDVLRGIRSE